MAAAEAGATSSPAPPKDLNPDEERQWYKNQYQNILSELHDYQDTSKEIEATLEQDLEVAETNQRKLQEKYESLGFEVDEWRVCISTYLLWLCGCVAYTCWIGQA
jgi:hypothetical protein